MGLVLGVEKVAHRDGPGLRTVVSLKGCRLRCCWCHSPEGQRKQREVVFHAGKCDACGACLDVCSSGAVVLNAAGRRLDRKRCHNCGLCIDSCPTGALKMSGEWLTVDQILARVALDRADYGTDGGVTLSGGDITLQPAFARDVLDACHDRGIDTAIEITGHAPWEVLQPLIDRSDLVLYDVKHSDPVAHRRYVGVDNALILANLRRTVESGARVQARVPLIPGCTDTDANLRATVDLVARLGVERIAFLPFKADAVEHYSALERVCWHSGCRPQAADRLEEIRQIGLRRGLRVEIVEWDRSPILV